MDFGGFGMRLTTIKILIISGIIRNEIKESQWFLFRTKGCVSAKVY